MFYRNVLLPTLLASPPRKLRSKKSKSCAKFVAEVALNLWQKLRRKIGKVALKLRAIWLIFACKILILVLWYFGKFWQRTTKQRLSILCRPNEVQKLDIFRNKAFVNGNDRYCKLRCNVISLATLAQCHRE